MLTESSFLLFEISLQTAILADFNLRVVRHVISSDIDFCF